PPTSRFLLFAAESARGGGCPDAHTLSPPPPTHTLPPLPITRLPPPQLSPRVAVVALPHVHWTDGGLVDLSKVSRACADVRAALVVDATQ
ncbi:hypothetical protein T492DRAFT_912914, partial [Pavlovales sp. CCMP2436]